MSEVGDYLRSNVLVVIAIQTFFLLFLQFGDKIMPSNFLARKACHAGSGLLMTFLDSNDIIARTFVYSVIVTSLSMTWKILPKWVP